MYYVYMLRCIDNSIYTGIATDLNRRMEEHFTKNEKCAKYTFRHTAKKIEAAWQTEDRKLASKLEYYIKTLLKSQKEELIKSNDSMNKLLLNKIDSNKYRRIESVN